MRKGETWCAVTQPQRTEAALQEWQNYLEAKGIETKIEREGKGFVLLRFGKDYFNGDYGK